MRRVQVATLAAAVVTGGQSGTAAVSFKLFCPAFEAGGEIPVRFTCEGADISPPLEWRGPPGGTKSFALIVDDPDAPDPAAPQRTWVHWVLYNLPTATSELAEGVGCAELPSPARNGTNDWGRTDYGGPCPPIGRHRYFHKLFALDVELPGLGEPTAQELMDAMEGHVLATAELVGTYQKQR